MYGFTPRSANQPASDKQLCYAYDLAERQGLDAEALCSIHFSKEFAEMPRSIWSEPARTAQGISSASKRPTKPCGPAC